MLHKLFEVIEERKVEMPAGSYTTSLFSNGEDEILKKIGEEAMEVILAAKGQGNARLIEETADLFYHTLVMLSYFDLTLKDVENELQERHTPK